jgi:hypothetical protein
MANLEEVLHTYMRINVCSLKRKQHLNSHIYFQSSKNIDRVVKITISRVANIVCNRSELKGYPPFRQKMRAPHIPHFLIRAKNHK